MLLTREPIATIITILSMFMVGFFLGYFVHPNLYSLALIPLSLRLFYESVIRKEPEPRFQSTLPPLSQQFKNPSTLHGDPILSIPLSRQFTSESNYLCDTHEIKQHFIQSRKLTNPYSPQGEFFTQKDIAQLKTYPELKDIMENIVNARQIIQPLSKETIDAIKALALGLLNAKELYLTEKQSNAGVVPSIAMDTLITFKSYFQAMMPEEKFALGNYIIYRNDTTQIASNSDHKFFSTPCLFEEVLKDLDILPSDDARSACFHGSGMWTLKMWFDMNKEAIKLITNAEALRNKVISNELRILLPSISDIRLFLPMADWLEENPKYEKSFEFTRAVTLLEP